MNTDGEAHEINTDETAQAVEVAAPGKARTPRRRSRALLLVAALLATTFGGSAAVTAANQQEADAWAWSSQVNLKGRAIACSRGATWVWVEASNGERGWATQPGGNYHFRFRHVPSRGMAVTVKFGNSSCSRQAKIHLKRPSVGETMTVNVVTIY